MNLSGFLAAFHRGIELGSLETVQPESIQPTFVLGKLWDDRLARKLVLAGFGLGIVLVLWTVFLITTVPEVRMGPFVGTNPDETVPSIRLVLYPVEDAFIFLVDLIGGTYFYRREDQKYAAYLLWAGGVIAPFLLIISLLLTTLRI